MLKKQALLLLLFWTSVSFSQYIKGKVVDELQQPLPGATVYYEGTTYATLSDDKGDFILIHDPKMNRPIVVSYVGYKTNYVLEYKVGTPIVISMQQDVNSLREVIIKKDRFSRKEKMAVFKERFLGRTPFGLRTDIENEEDLVLQYDEENFVLKVSSSKPLIVVNRALGYKINYDLVDFEVQFSMLTLNPHAIKNSYYAGYTRFEEIKNTSSVQKNREEAYRGSQTHFLRNLTKEIWGGENFVLFCKGQLTNPKDHFTIVKEEDRYRVEIKKQDIGSVGEKAIAIFGLLFNKSNHSSVHFFSETIYVDFYGNNLSPRDIAYSGHIQSKRLGDTLPINYGL